MRKRDGRRKTQEDSGVAGRFPGSERGVLWRRVKDSLRISMPGHGRREDQKVGWGSSLPYLVLLLCSMYPYCTSKEHLSPVCTNFNQVCTLHGELLIFVRVVVCQL